MLNTNPLIKPMKVRRKTPETFIILVVLFSLLTHLYAQFDPSDTDKSALQTEIKVGVILDMGSWLGKTIHSCVNMAISDFYALNIDHKTKIVLHTRDSKGETLLALSAALDLLENVNVQAIIGPETSHATKFLAILGDKAKVPILSFAASASISTEYPFLVQITHDQTTQFKAITTILEYYKWRDVILIYEDTHYVRESISYITDSFQEKNIRIAFKCAISPMATDEQIREELLELITMRTAIFVVHISPSLTSRFFSKAKRLGMMSEGHSWIITDKTMNFIDSLDLEAIKSLKGALGLKPYIPASKELQNFTLRWRKDYHTKDATLLEVRELIVFGIWAYDAAWALAKAVEMVRIEILNSREKGPRLNVIDLANIGESQSGIELLDQLVNIKFKGLSGDFKLVNGQLFCEAFEIVNVIGKGDETIGFWTITNGLTKEIDSSTRAMYGLEAIIWPGGSSTTPKGRKTQISNKRLRIGAPVNSRFYGLMKFESDHNFSGYCIDVFKASIESLPYEISYDFIPHNGTFTALLDEVYFQNFDAAVGDITITSNRSSYVDFTTAFTDIGLGTVAKTVNRNEWFFLEPLDADLWLTIAGLFIGMTFVIGIIEYHENKEIQNLPATEIGTILLFSLSVLVFARSDKLQSKLSIFLATGWVFVMLVLISSYTAILSSVLTVQQIQIASKDSIGYPSSSEIISGAAVTNLNFTNGSFRRYDSPEEYAQGLSLGSKHGGVAAIIDEIPYIKVFLGKYSTGYSMVRSEPTTNGFGIAFQKGSPLSREMSTAIERLREDGTLLKLEYKWFKKGALIDQNSQGFEMSKPNTLRFENFRGLFLYFGVSVALVLLIFLIHLVYEKLLDVKNFIFKILVGGKLAIMMRYIYPRNGYVIEDINRR